jgi:hypothetical protein
MSNLLEYLTPEIALGILKLIFPNNRIESVKNVLIKPLCDKCRCDLKEELAFMRHDGKQWWICFVCAKCGEVCGGYYPRDVDVLALRRKQYEKTVWVGNRS